MVMKKLGVFAVFLFLMILSLGFTSAADSCEIKSSCSTGEYSVMGLSSDTNAHGELWDEGNYEYALCCNFGGGDRECSSYLHPVYGENAPANKIIGLSSLTNAHAEIPQESNYGTEFRVCYENLACISTEEGCGPDYPMEVLSLSDYTNAHIGDYGDYDIDICCDQIECREEVDRCRDYNGKECDSNPCREAVAYPSVAENDDSGGIICGEGYTCGCAWNETTNECGPSWEAIRPWCGNDEIDPSLSEECDGTNMPTIECDDVGCTGGAISCYPQGHDNECRLDKSGCTGCVEGGVCGDSLINNFPFETCDTNNLSEKTCADFGLTGDGLACYDPTHANNCTFNTTGCIPLKTHPSKIGKCNYDEDTDDNCDDNFLTYSWTATWTWDPENIFDVNPNGGDYIQGDDEKWHYDPNEVFKKCVDGSNTVPCPAQIQLPFFGSYSIVVILVLIALIYVILTWKKKKFNSKGKVKKK